MTKRKPKTQEVSDTEPESTDAESAPIDEMPKPTKPKNHDAILPRSKSRYVPPLR